MIALYNLYNENGVIIMPNVIGQGSNPKVIYKGLLYQSGADEVYMHVGYGNNWDNVMDIKMKRTENGFEGTLPMLKCDNIKIAFKDSADNWDNNAGRDYSFEVQER
ncbi:MAG: carbohydrate-binding protein [Clostridiaceae bacterium]|nr:carbohydrate-binding protein [Clostridiaceae bacterium]